MHMRWWRKINDRQNEWVREKINVKELRSGVMSICTSRVHCPFNLRRFLLLFSFFTQNIRRRYVHLKYFEDDDDDERDALKMNMSANTFWINMREYESLRLIVNELLASHRSCVYFFRVRKNLLLANWDRNLDGGDKLRSFHQQCIHSGSTSGHPPTILFMTHINEIRVWYLKRFINYSLKSSLAHSLLHTHTHWADGESSLIKHFSRSPVYSLLHLACFYSFRFFNVSFLSLIALSLTHTPHIPNHRSQERSSFNVCTFPHDCCASAG
jgi:hypothetical protein